MWRAIIYDNLATKFEDVVNTYAEHQPEGNHLDDLWVSFDPYTRSDSRLRQIPVPDPVDSTISQ
jgi:hypothetical protein